ncbi:hypothetical protein [Brachybacterium sp. J153]|uniref:hypothetical protein n=1 Tax=Brachybacterium sp. J153 TaxID=3116488 RepID=UPI002E797029|nr:hypothetical protein [Brachybacterium sp. J153]MEE1618895.1 hypothetical protein [Brachybacterium sp. J153]
MDGMDGIERTRTRTGTRSANARRVVGRRAALTHAALAVPVLLSGCVPGSAQRRVNEAAESAEGVTRSELVLGTGGTFGAILYGDITCAVAGVELEAVLDESWRAVVTLLHDDGGEDDRSVQNVIGRAEDGTAVDVLEWLPERDPGSVTVADFFSRYGLG